MVDIKDNGEEEDRLIPLNLIKRGKKRGSAVAIKDSSSDNDKDKGIPTITAAGRGAIADKIVDLAFEHGIKVRHDEELAEMLATIELDSPIPSEAFLAVAEILSYVYKSRQN